MLGSCALTHVAELQRHPQPAAHRISDEGESGAARDGIAQKVGRNTRLSANSKIARRSGAFCSELRSALGQWRRSHGYRAQQDSEGVRRVMANNAWRTCGLR